MLGTRSRSWVAGAAVLGLMAVGVAAPALAQEPEPPPLVWELVSTTTIDGVTVTWERAETRFSPFDPDVEMLDPMPVYRPDIVNGSGETLYFGIGMDFFIQGVVDELWTPEVWGEFGDEMIDAGALGNFLVELEGGESYSETSGTWYQGMPALSGHTLTIFALELTGVEGENPTASPIASITTPGRFVAADFSEADINNPSAVVGERAVVASSGGAPELFAGLSGTVEASGLPAGATLELWVAKELDYALFQLLGGGLPVGARQVGSGTVGSDGVLSTGFALPIGLESGRYQLVVGDRSERYWPAGSYDDFVVSDPPPGLVVDATTAEAGEGGESVGLQWEAPPIADLVVGITYPEGSTGGTTTALYSTTGPLPAGFTLATDPPLYLHINTTVGLAGPAQVCVNYDPAVVTGDPPRLFHFDVALNEWTDITDDSEVGPGYVCGYTASFSPFALGIPDDGGFAFEGFFPPVSMDAENIAKAGQAIPVKFSLGGYQGPDVVTSARFVLTGSASSLVGETIPITSIAESGLTYDAATDEYTYVWKTNKAWALKSGEFALTLSDGSVRTFDVTFKK